MRNATVKVEPCLIERVPNLGTDLAGVHRNRDRTESITLPTPLAYVLDIERCWRMVSMQHGQHDYRRPKASIVIDDIDDEMYETQTQQTRC